ncbi:hypothetical protein BKA62DRAFT_497973 [Auriculariales sp. MPI-PUGE-AT-0066]|nr:hypothetical protein BKA62DRAFT_497973 [Auriculariales sp. MPI-PUGE-AT-0066]
MPTCRRKRVMLTEPSSELLADLKVNPDKQVFYLAQTGEIFADYESYSSRMSFYKAKQFQCDVTGKGGLDFFQALTSEQQEARTLHSRFPEQLKGPVLRAVQWRAYRSMRAISQAHTRTEVMGRIDQLVEAVHERFKDRYFEGERVFVELDGEKFWARIIKANPPGSTVVSLKRPRASSGAAAPAPPKPKAVHAINGDLKQPIAEVNAKDDPLAYMYTVQIIDEPGSDGPRKLMPNETVSIKAGSMSRDRLAFSKSILRRFVRDCVDRDSAIASPWTVKKSIAERYGVEINMPEATRKGVDEIKRGEMEKRRKVATPPKKEEKPDRPAKKQKKMTAEERAQLLKEEEEELAALEALERERELAATKTKKKKVVKFPAEDLDVTLTAKEKKENKMAVRPALSRDLPFYSIGKGVFERFLMSWNFLHIFSQPLNLSTFTLDDFESALRHNTSEVTCSLIAEVHVALMGVLRNLHAQKHQPALVSLMQEDDAETDLVPVQDLLTRMETYGQTWEKQLPKAADGRSGWEDSLVGCLKDNASVQSFPRLRDIVTYLLYDTAAIEASRKTGWTPLAGNSAAPPSAHPIAEPADRYPTLPPSDKIAVIAYLCDLAITARPIHHFMDNCETKLTELRKEKVEINKEKKRLVDSMAEVVGKVGLKDDPMQVDGEAESAGSDTEESTLQLPVVGEVEGAIASTGSLRQRTMRMQAHKNALAKQKELAASKSKGAQAALEEHIKLTDELARQDRRMDAIELDFRRYIGVRLRPMGKDRFYNRVWWFDGLGGGNLVNAAGQTLIGAGRLFIQGAGEYDTEVLVAREAEEHDVVKRREDEETPEFMLQSDEWGTYETPEQLDEFFAWLQEKGNRELALKKQLFIWWDHIVAGVKKRQADMSAVALAAAKPVESTNGRRSTRGRNSSANELARESYMQWTNKLAKNPSTNGA